MCSYKIWRKCFHFCARVSFLDQAVARGMVSVVWLYWPLEGFGWQFWDLQTKWYKFVRITIASWNECHSPNMRHCFRLDTFKIPWVTEIWVASIDVNKCPTRCDYTQLILSVNCSTCLGWFLHPSSGAQITVSTAPGTSQPLLLSVAVVELRLNSSTIVSGSSNGWLVPDAVDTLFVLLMVAIV